MSQIVALGIRPLGFGVGLAVGGLAGLALGVVIADIIVRVY